MIYSHCKKRAVMKQLPLCDFGVIGPTSRFQYDTTETSQVQDVFLASITTMHYQDAHRLHPMSIDNLWHVLSQCNLECNKPACTFYVPAWLILLKQFVIYKQPSASQEAIQQYVLLGMKFAAPRSLWAPNYHHCLSHPLSNLVPWILADNMPYKVSSMFTPTSLRSQ